MKSQVSLELLISVAVLLLILIPIVTIFYTDIQTRVNIAKARDAVDRIAAAAEYVSKLGDGSRMYVEVNLPTNIKSINVSGKEILIQLYTPAGVTDVYASCDCNLTGYIPKTEGYKKIRILKYGNKVIVGNVLRLEPSYLYFELTRGETATRNGNITNLLPLSQNISYTLEDPTGWVNFTGPTFLAPEESDTYTFMVNVSSTADKGRYYGRIIAEATYGVEYLNFLIRIVGNLTNLLILTDETYFPGDTVTVEVVPYDNFGENVQAQINTTIVGPSTTITQEDYTNHQTISFTLDTNCSLVCGTWNVTSTATKKNTITNQTSFRVGAIAEINFCADETCSIYTKAYNYSDWWNSSWRYRIPIHVYAAADMLKLDVMLELNSSNFDFSKANSDGSDIRIITSSGVERPLYIEYWNSTEEKAIIWFDADVVTGDNLFYIYFGNENATSVSNGSAVFDFFDDVNTTKWTSTGLWHITTCDYHSPVRSWWYAIENPDCTGSYDTGARTYGYIQAGPIDLSDATNEQVIVKFWRWYEVEYYAWSAYDVMRFQVSRNGVTWTTLKQWDSTQPSQPYWVNDSVDVTSYISWRFYMRFYFDSIDGYYNDYEGWKIDDVVIYRTGNYNVSFGGIEEYGKMYIKVDLMDLNGVSKIGSINFTLLDPLNSTKLEESKSGASTYIFNYNLTPSDVGGTWKAIVLWTDIWLRNESSVEVIV